MRSLARAGVLAGGVAAALLGLFVVPAAADYDYHPSDADFADCPALPANAKPETWNCFFIITVGGSFKLGTIEQEVTQPIRITVAQGQLQDGTAAAAFGSVVGAPQPVPGGLLGPPFEVPGLTDVSVQPRGTGLVTPGFLFPATVGMKFRLINPLLGRHCYIGSDRDPITLTPQIDSLEFTAIDGIGVIKIAAHDNTFAVPGASGCGLGLGLINKAVNLRAGLPSASGKNAATLRWFARVKAYAPAT